MIDRTRLLEDLKATSRGLIDDLRARTEAVEDVRGPVHAQYATARAARRTDRSYEEWREDLLAQVAVGWVLGTVFVRFCEDNGLWPVALLSGPGDGRDLARDHRTDWLSRHPASGDRDWLLDVFVRYRDTPATSGVFGFDNPLWQFGPSDDGARALLELCWSVNPETGALRHDFTDPDLDTRFLGDLYQDLSDHAKKNFALLQTPEFVEEFILDRTLDPAVDEFGLATVRMIDPTCGSGHFLLGAFDRLFERWREREPGTPARELAQRVLNAVHGVDLNPFAVAIARFRLLVAALKASGIKDLRNAPDFDIRVATGDSLLHGRRSGDLFTGTEGSGALLEHRYPTEDEDEANRILETGQYHAVVGNPPYITVKDPALRLAYRDRYASASGKYSLGVPFTERFFDLAQSGGTGRSAGFVGMITTNSFMKRSFGRKLIEEFLPSVELSHVIDTSGAFIPGHGTPTVILFGRNRHAIHSDVRAVLGIRGEPGAPQDPRRGQVWQSILRMIDTDGSENDYISVEDVPREVFGRHPWGMQGGAAPEAKAAIEEAGTSSLDAVASSIGITCFTLEDAAFLVDPATARRSGVVRTCRPMVIGEALRDWIWRGGDLAVFPYDANFEPLSDSLPAPVLRHLWPNRQLLRTNRMFGNKTKVQAGLHWSEYGRLTADKLRTPLSITFAAVATHNHFVLDCGGTVFKQSALVIKLPKSATETDYLRLLGLTNSSTACFWMKQVFHNKGEGGGARVDAGYSALGDEPWKSTYDHDGTKLKQFPIPASAPLGRTRALDALAKELAATSPARLLEQEAPIREALDAARARAATLRARMVALQEELDWECYDHYGLTERNHAVPADQLPELRLGERAFEIALARRIAKGGAKSTWFERHSSTPITELPADWPDAYREAVEARLKLIESDRKLRLLERPEYKRRWDWDAWKDMEQAAVRDWLLDRIEALSAWKDPELQTVGRLADLLSQDDEALEAARIFAGRSDVDLPALIASLVEDEMVPYLAPIRFKPSGLRKRRAWEETWALQRIEDEIDVRATLPPEDPKHIPEGELETKKKEAGVKKIPVPPKYTAADFARTSWYRLRGKLDVPKERFISYPDTRIGADPSAVLGWAGWDHLTRAQALAAHYQRRKDERADESELLPLLAGLEELVPWLVQWHNAPDPRFGESMGDFFRTFVDSEVRALGYTAHDLRSWPLPS